MLLASCGAEIKFHKWPSGDYFGSYQIPEAGFCIPSMSWSSDGELLVTTVPSLGPPIVVSVKDTGMQTYQVIDIPQIQAASFSWTIQNNIAFGTDSGEVLIYDIGQKCRIEHLPVLPSGIKYLQYGAQDKILAAGCKNGQICLYNTKDTVCATFYIPNCNSLSAMSCHSKFPHLLAAAGVEGIVVVWDISTGNAEFLDKSHNASTTDVAFSSGDALASVGLDEKLVGYDLRTRECVFCCKTNEQLSAVEFMPGGTQIAVGTIDGKLLWYDTRAMNHPVHTLIAHHPKAVVRIAFQNTPFVEESINNEGGEIQQDDPISKRSKSDLTTVYNKSRPQSCYHNETSSTSLSLPSTINTIVPDVNSDNFNPEDLIAYLENRGDTGNHTKANVLNKSPFTSKENTELEEAVKNWMIKNQSNSNNLEQNEDVMKLQVELQELTKEAIEQLTEMINREFLKVRMAVSRGFVQMECKMNARWAEHNKSLMKLAGGYISSHGDELENGKEIEESSSARFPSMRLSARSFTKQL